IGLALDSTGGDLYVADRDNNAIRKLDFPTGQTITFTTEQISKPVGVTVDPADNLYVLNQGSANNGTVLKFDKFGYLLGTLASGLVNANGITVDGAANVYITVNGNQVVRITPAGVQTTVATISIGGTLLKGIALMDSGNLAVVDSGRNAILSRNPPNRTASNITA